MSLSCKIYYVYSTFSDVMTVITDDQTCTSYRVDEITKTIFILTALVIECWYRVDRRTKKALP